MCNQVPSMTAKDSIRVIPTIELAPIIALLRVRLISSFRLSRIHLERFKIVGAVILRKSMILAGLGRAFKILKVEVA